MSFIGRDLIELLIELIEELSCRTMEQKAGARASVGLRLPAFTSSTRHSSWYDGLSYQIVIVKDIPQTPS
jgi:hypothetical protein